MLAPHFSREDAKRLYDATIAPQAHIGAPKLITARLKHMKFHDTRPMFLIALAGLLLTLPALVFGFPPITDDATFHSVWSQHFATQLWAGDPYPRWMPGINAGLGSPVFFFYAPVPYYAASLFHPLLGGADSSWRLLGVAVVLATIASGVGCYRWLRQSTDERAATFAAILYMFAPYHLAVDLYTRGAYAEFWAFVWMPMILLSVQRISKNDGDRRRRAVVWLAISYALLIMTHVPTTLIFSPLPLAYAVFSGDARRQRWRTLLLTAGGMMLGAGLAAIYLLPAMSLQDTVALGGMKSVGGTFAERFLFTGFKIWGDEEAKLSAMVLTMLAATACAVLFILPRADKGLKREAAFWSMVVAAALFMMTPISFYVWRLVKPLQTVQFPFRFCTVLTLAMSPLFARAFSAAVKPFSKLTWCVLACACAVACIWTAATALAARSAYPVTNPMPDEMARVNDWISASRDPSEYRPRWSDSRTTVDEIARRAGRFDTPPLKARVVDDNVEDTTRTQIEVLGWRPRDIRLRVSTPRDTKIVVNQFYFPGWTAHTNDSETGLTVEPSPDDGLIAIAVPSGEHEISLRLTATKPERAGQIISLLSLLLALTIFAVRCRREAAPSN